MRLSELGLSYTQRDNFQKLRYWGLVEKVGDPEGKGGIWQLTATAERFLSGQLKLPKYVWTYRGTPERSEGPEVHASEVVEGWKPRPQYAREAEPAGLALDRGQLRIF